MKVFILIWAIVQVVLLVAGFAWAIIDRKNPKRKKASAILIAVASFMIAIFFLVFFPMMKK